MGTKQVQLVILLLLGVSGTNSQQCTLPSQSEISTTLRTYLISTGGESSTITVNLQNYQFTCQAVAARDMYRSLSVAVQYITTDSGVTSAVQYEYAQFQLECVTGSPNHYQLPSSAPFEANVSPSLLTIPTRRDCQFCTGLTSGPAGLDTTANCFACSSTCLGVGQGACAAGGTTCCPFFNTDGSCTTACATNYTASSDTNYICECTFSCALGYEANSVCDSCAPVHICLTNDPCQNGATCNIGTNSNTDYTCSCVSSFTGKNCSTRVSSCSPNPCQNGGRCLNAGEGYACVCSNSWRGTNCTECGVTNCTQCSQSREGCENCDREYSLDVNRQCTAALEGLTPWVMWFLVGISILLLLIIIVVTIFIIVVVYNKKNNRIFVV